MSDAVRPVQTIEQVAALAMKLGARHLSDYGANTSRHDFTQRQLMACLILRAYTKTTYRGILELLAVSPSLRQELALTDKLPHYSTLAKFSERSQVLEIARREVIGTIGQSPLLLPNVPNRRRQRWTPPGWRPRPPAPTFNAGAEGNGASGSRSPPLFFAEASCR